MGLKLAFIKGAAIMKSKIFGFLTALLFVVSISGCYRATQDTMTFNRYYRTALKVSNSNDVIPMIGAEGETLTLGENAVASSGSAKKGSVIWFNTVAFDDETSKAFRKYGFVANPKAKRQSMRFDAKLVIDPLVLSKPHANDNARKIAILKSILADFSNDLKPLVKKSDVLNSGTMMVKQMLNGLIYKLQASPSLAENLENFSGMDFDHMNLGEAKIRMVIVDGVVEIKVMTGKAVKNFDKQLDILSM